ncbi:thiol-disulfide oxidoreductase DCC family protein [Cohnella algarum]|uniref:thiol-disulfide oxidoreductase DCC family protein n=1 Tax=Cohnella algarum TaxID=2044859 RepID=UPI001F072CE7|nr:thiol-disulfide oxidoreductase DCC family protein [Cohnella algarum]
MDMHHDDGGRPERPASRRELRTPRNGEPAILLVDGHCILCQGITRFVARHDPRARFRFASLQSRLGKRWLAERGMAADRLDTFVLIERGRHYTKADAALRVFRGLPWPWPLLYGLRIVPSGLRNAVYDWVARNRYRWFGRSEACLVPDERLKSRFLEDEE